MTNTTEKGAHLPTDESKPTTVDATSASEKTAPLSNLALGNLIQNVNQAQENAVSFQQSQNSIQATVLGKVVNMLTQLGPLEAMSAQQVPTESEIAENLAAVKEELATGTKA